MDLSAPRSPAGGRAAYSLIELVLASSVMAIVLLGAQFAVVVACRAIPSGRNGPSAIAIASAVQGAMADDISVAMAFSTLGAREIQVTVPDRNGDGADDSIRYVWSGTAGAALQRQVNDGALATVAENVQSFSLVYDRVQVALPTTYSEGAEQLLYGHDAASGLQIGQIKSDTWWSQYFRPTIPAHAGWWRVTQVTFGAQKKSGNTGIAKAQLRRSTSNQPFAQVLGERSVLESNLTGSMGEQDVEFELVTGLQPGDALCLVFQWVADAEAFEIKYHTATGVGASPLMTSANNGGSWSTVAKSELVFGVYGKVALPDPVEYEYRLAGVRCRIQCGSTVTSGVSTGWPVLNTPVVSGP